MGAGNGRSNLGGQASYPELRQRLIDIKKSYEQTIDTVSADSLIEAGFSAEATDHARDLVESFKQFPLSSSLKSIKTKSPPYRCSTAAPTENG